MRVCRPVRGGRPPIPSLLKWKQSCCAHTPSEKEAKAGRGSQRGREGESWGDDALSCRRGREAAKQTGGGKRREMEMDGQLPERTGMPMAPQYFSK